MASFAARVNAQGLAKIAATATTRATSVAIDAAIDADTAAAADSADAAAQAWGRFDPCALLAALIAVGQ